MEGKKRRNDESWLLPFVCLITDYHEDTRARARARVHSATFPRIPANGHRISRHYSGTTLPCARAREVIKEKEYERIELQWIYEAKSTVA